MDKTWQSYGRAWGIYILCVVGIIFIQTLPLSATSYSVYAPDFILLISLGLALRYPLYASPVLIACALLFADFMFQRPPGLWAFLCLSATLILRARGFELRETVFLIEWGYAAAAITYCYAAYHMLLLLTFLPTPGLSLALPQACLTLLAYPLVIWCMSRFSRERKKKKSDKAL